MYQFIIPAIVTGASYLAIRDIERSTDKINGGRLPPWRRLLIPVPLILFLIANLDGILSLLSYLDTHLAVPARYPESQAWNSDRFFIAGIVSFLLVPLLLIPDPTAPGGSSGTFGSSISLGSCSPFVFVFNDRFSTPGLELS